jgi:hypothetical protein
MMCRSYLQLVLKHLEGTSKIGHTDLDKIEYLKFWKYYHSVPAIVLIV